MQRKILALFYDAAHTSDEVAALLGVNILTARPRVAELVKKGYLTDSGRRRENTSGKFAAVWVMKKNDQQFLPLAVSNNNTNQGQPNP